MQKDPHHVHENILATKAEISVISKEVDLPVRASFRPSHLLDPNAPPAQRRHVCPFGLQRDLQPPAAALPPVSSPRHLHLHLAVTDARVLHGEEPIVAAAQLEANVELTYDRPHRVQPPPGYVPRHDQILYAPRVEPDLERLLVHESVARRRGEISLRVRAPSPVLGPRRPSVRETAVQRVAPFRSAFQLERDHGTDPRVLVHVGQGHVYQHIVSALGPVTPPVGIVAVRGLVAGHACRWNVGTSGR